MKTGWIALECWTWCSAQEESALHRKSSNCGCESLRGHDSCKAGEPLALEPGETVEPQSGTDLPTSAAMAQGTDTLFLPLKNGFYARMNASGDDRWIAVNTFDPAESDLRQPPGRSVTFAREHFSGWRVFLHFGVWPPWQYLTLSALGLFALEWWLFHRRRTE